MRTVGSVQQTDEAFITARVIRAQPDEIPPAIREQICRFRWTYAACRKCRGRESGDG